MTTVNAIRAHYMFLWRFDQENERISICSQTEVASEVISDAFVRRFVVNRAVKFGDNGLHHCQDIRLTVDTDCNFAPFTSNTPDRK